MNVGKNVIRIALLMGITILLILITTDGVLTYVVSKSVLRPIETLTSTANHIKDGNNDNEIIFTTKEFDLLTFLAEHPNRVFSNDGLFERIWGIDSMGDIATVTVHVGKIRDKIEANPSKPQYIETVWGAGYRFKV